MENRINQLIVLEDNKKYIILDQAIYNNENYFAVAVVTEDETDIKKEFDLIHEIKENDKYFFERVTDPELKKLLIEHLK